MGRCIARAAEPLRRLRPPRNAGASSSRCVELLGAGVVVFASSQDTSDEDHEAPERDLGRVQAQAVKLAEVFIIAVKLAEEAAEETKNEPTAAAARERAKAAEENR